MDTISATSIKTLSSRKETSRRIIIASVCIMSIIWLVVFSIIVFVLVDEYYPIYPKAWRTIHRGMNPENAMDILTGERSTKYLGRTKVGGYVSDEWEWKAHKGKWLMSVTSYVNVETSAPEVHGVYVRYDSNVFSKVRLRAWVTEQDAYREDGIGRFQVCPSDNEW